LKGIMNCREAKQHIFAEPDGALASAERAALAAHLNQCEACQQIHTQLTRTIAVWRTETKNLQVPDADLEWQKLRREIRGGTTSARRYPLGWFALPLAAAAAVAMFFFSPSLNRPETPARTTTEIASTAPNAASPNASTVVFVDDKSGWTFVWTGDDAAQHI
jgi:anti-sigma factor RsiW